MCSAIRKPVGRSIVPAAVLISPVHGFPEQVAAAGHRKNRARLRLRRRYQLKRSVADQRQVGRGAARRRDEIAASPGALRTVAGDDVAQLTADFKRTPPQRQPPAAQGFSSTIRPRRRW